MTFRASGTARAAEGAAFQLTREGIADNRYAAGWLAERRFPNPVVIGHSNGGMLVVKHVLDHPETRAMGLLSAHGGGSRRVVRQPHRCCVLRGRMAQSTS